MVIVERTPMISHVYFMLNTPVESLAKMPIEFDYYRRTQSILDSHMSNMFMNIVYVMSRVFSNGIDQDTVCQNVSHEFIDNI
jgi:hypothetical protein